MKLLPRALFLLAAIATAASAEPDAKTVRTWKAKCASCHGVDGKGDTDQGKKMKLPDMTDAGWQKSHTEAQVKTVIADGVKKDGKEMDAYKDKLAPEQIDALAAYVKTLK